MYDLGMEDTLKGYFMPLLGWNHEVRGECYIHCLYLLNLTEYPSLILQNADSCLQHLSIEFFNFGYSIMFKKKQQQTLKTTYSCDLKGPLTFFSIIVTGQFLFPMHVTFNLTLIFAVKIFRHNVVVVITDRKEAGFLRTMIFQISETCR